MPLYAQIKGPVGYETIGSPTMTDGIATGFSASNYYKLDTEFRPGCNTWEILTRVKISSFSAKCTFISYAATNTRSFQVGTTNTGAINVYISSNGTSCDIANGTYSTEKLSLDTYYYVLSKFTGTTYEVLVSEDKENWTTFLTVNSSTPVWQGTFFSLGYNFSQYPEPMNGYIDFNESYIKIGDTAFWGKTFASVKIRMPSSVMYSVVGTPTIVNGIASNFSTSNYVQIPMPNFSTSNDWEMVFKVKINALTSTYQVFGTSSYSNPAVGLDIDKNGKLYAAIGNSAGTSWMISEGSSSWQGTVKTVPLETFFWAKLAFNGSRYTIYYSEDGKNWEETIYYNSTSKISYDSSYNFNIGTGRMANNFSLKGEIDFNETYIKIDGQYYFNGKFQNLTWTPHILEGDYGFNTNGDLVYSNKNIYLENTQESVANYIDTGITANTLTSAEVDYKIESSREISSSTRNWIIGGSAVYQKYENFYGGFWQTASSNIYYWLNTSNKGSGANAGSSFTDFTKRYKLELNGAGIDTKSYIYKEDGTSWSYANNEGEISQTSTLKLFNRGAGTGETTAFLGKIYSLKLKQNNNLVRNLIPVPKGLYIKNQIIPTNGMWDVVSQQFYANQGSGSFEFGGMEKDYIIVDGKLIWANPKLYLQNDASNWIDTGLTGNYTFYITAQGVTKKSSSQIMIGTSPNNAFSWWGTYSNNGYWSFTNETKSIDWLEKGDFIVHFTATGSYYECNGTTYTPTSGSSPVRSLTYALFRSKQTNSYYAMAKLFNCIIYDENNNVVQYLVPVPKDLQIGNFTVPSNGLFDIVTQTFFANQGTGTFIFGKDS